MKRTAHLDSTLCILTSRTGQSGVPAYLGLLAAQIRLLRTKLRLCGLLAGGAQLLFLFLLVQRRPLSRLKVLPGCSDMFYDVVHGFKCRLVV